MAAIRQLRDTFLHYLADNLPAIIFHPVRFDSTVPEGNQLQVNAVNVTFHNGVLDTHKESEQLVSLDVLNDKELSAMDVVEQVAQLLQTAAFALLYDYSSGSAVLSGSKRIYWDTQIKFRPVVNENYFHMSAMLTLKVQFI